MNASKAMWIAGAIGCAFLGCAGQPLKGGKATIAGRTPQEITQPENPAQASKQAQETVKVKSYTVPAHSIVETVNVAPASKEAPAQTNTQRVTLSAPMPVTEREEVKAASELGASQKDTAREIGAKLASLRGVVWLGVAVFLFGLASAFWPPLKAIVGSVTTSAAACAGGLALIFLPSVIVGHELLLIFGTIGGVGVWWFAHRHGQLRGLIAEEKKFTGNSKITPASENSG